MYPEQPNQPPQPTPPSGVPPQTPTPQPIYQPTQPPYSQTPSQPSPTPNNWQAPQQQAWPQAPTPGPTPNPYVGGQAASLDYLNSISAPQQASGFSRKQVAILGAILLLAFGILGAFIVSRNLQGPDTQVLAVQVYARSTSLSEIAKQASPNLRSRQLVLVNSNLIIQLTNTEAQLKSFLAESNIKADSIPKDTVSSQAATDLSEKLAEAKLNATYDAVYQREMVPALQHYLLNMQKLYNTAKNEAFKAKISSLYDSLEPLYNDLKAVEFRQLH